MSDHHGRRDESFRDALATVDKAGKRVWVYPKKPKGRYYKWRTWLSVVFLVFLFAAPFVHIKGQQFMLFNVLERQFVVFGQAFWPQDFHLLVITLITGIVFIILFTVAFGRVFCGWVCPQTIFMEMVFRKIEYAIEGDWKQQRALNKAPWDAKKVWKKSLKHAIFFAISFLIANTFLAYIIGSGQLLQIISEPPQQHLGGLISLSVFSLTFYGVFAFMREQVCTTVCPYGRLQGVLLDRNSIVIAYDHERGEGRAKFRKNEDRAAANKGDCIDCNQCVNVCPTGIDIRNGTQLECVNCTACIDACDDMMDAVGLERGLIRYASESEIADKRKFAFTTRLKAYTGVLSLLIIVMLSMIVLRSEVETQIIRARGTSYTMNDDGTLTNLFNYNVLNKTSEPMPIHFVLEDERAELQLVGKEIVAEVGQNTEGALFIRMPESELNDYKEKMRIGVYSGDRLIETVKVTFMGPIGPR